MTEKSKKTTIPIMTRHFYPLDEIKWVAVQANRAKDLNRWLFSLVELDVTGYSQSSWKIMAQSILEDGFDNPNILVGFHSSLHKWNKILKEENNGRTSDSFKNETSAKTLIQTATDIFESKKSRLVYDALVCGVKHPMDEIKKIYEDLTSKDDFYPQEMVQFFSSVFESISHAKGKETNENQIQTTLMVVLFYHVLEKTWDAWCEYSRSKTFKPKEREALLEKVKHWELVLLSTLQIFYSMHEVEGRNLIKKEKKEKKKKTNHYINQQVKTLSESFLELIPKINSGCKYFYEHFCSSIWTLIVKFIETKVSHNKDLLFVVSLLMEMSANKLGINNLELLLLSHAVLYTVREMDISWNAKQWIQIKMEDKNWDLVQKWYQDCPPLDNTKLDLLFKRRELKIIPDYLDIYSSRTNGRSNLNTLVKDLNSKGIDISLWSEDEKRKSHGLGISFLGQKIKEESISMNETAMEHMFSTVWKIHDSINEFDTYYSQMAKQILLNEEKKLGFKSCTLSKLIKTQYHQVWIKTTELCESVPLEAVEKNEKKTKKEIETTLKVSVEKEPKKKNTSKKRKKEEDKEEDEKQEKKKRKTKKSDDVSTGRKKKKETIPNKPLNFKPEEVISFVSVNETEWKQIEELPLAQKPSFVSKKKIFVDLENVYKGPFEITLSKDFDALCRILYKTHIIQNVFNEKKLVLPVELILNPEKTKCFLKMKNVGKLNSSILNNHIETVDCTVKTQSIKVKILDVVYAGYDHASKLFDMKSFDSLALDCFKGLIMRYILAIDDSNLKKFLVSENQIFMIDLEEKRTFSKESKDELLDMLFTKKLKNTKRLIYLLNQHKKELLNWLDSIKGKDICSLEFAQKIKMSQPLIKDDVDERISQLCKALQTF